jgi:adenylate cyclase
LRIGLNSGEVIAGEIGSGPLGYTAIGEQVGMAQRMESVATPGGVMISESTARLVENAATLGEVELVRIKGSEDPVPARRLLAISTGRGSNRVETSLVGRQWEIGALSGLLDRAGNGKGCVVGVVGPPGIGKSRIVREIASRATDADFEMFTTYCESHTTDVPFHAAAGLVRAITSSIGLDGAAARTQVRARFSGADDEDLLILEDLLGIGDPAATLPQIDPDARRRRLAAMVNAAALTRSTPTVYVIEDAHWIDGISESMLADFLSVVPRTRSLVMITYRPEYVGALAHAPRSQTIALEPLDDSQMSQLSTELLGKDRSVTGLADLVAERAAGNPFFAEEIVRDLTERDVLIGGRGCYLCVEPATDVSVPSTLQAVIAARIDRLEPAAKRALNAAAVIGSQFRPDLLRALGIDPTLEDLLRAELVDQTAFTPQVEYAFRHPLIRAVAYESQLRSARAELHRRLARLIESRDPQSVDENAALIAEHFEAAGDLHAAFGWHMRAANWYINRDVVAARAGWQRARHVADQLPSDDPERLGMRIAPRTLLCASAWRAGGSVSDTGFDELRGLAEDAGDKRSLAIAMAGLVISLNFHGRYREAVQSAVEYTQLIESIGDPLITIGMALAPMNVMFEAGFPSDTLQMAQRVIDLADGDATKANMIVGSPLSLAVAMRGLARSCLGIPGWREDFDNAVAMARAHDFTSWVGSLLYKYFAIANGALTVGAIPLEDSAELLEGAEQSGDNTSLGSALLVHGQNLADRDGAERQLGLQLLSRLRDFVDQERFTMTAIPVIDIETAGEKAQLGELDDAIELIRATVDRTCMSGLMTWVPNTSVLFVELLLRRGDVADLRDAAAAVDRLAAAAQDCRLTFLDLALVRLRALVARARGDEASYRDYRDRYRVMANELGFEGHMAWAEAMA